MQAIKARGLIAGVAGHSLAVAKSCEAAGAIHPKEGFRYAYHNGADFVCAGMFDFQIQEDAAFARETIEKAKARPRPWRV